MARYSLELQWPKILMNLPFHISKTREWASGLARRRIDGLLDMLPIEEQGTIHIDVFSPNPSRYHGVTTEQELEAMKEILRYWRSRGVDVTKEWFHHEFAGLIRMVYHLNLDEASRLKYPPSVICGGGEGWNQRHKRTVFNPCGNGTPEGGCRFEQAWGRSTDTDESFHATNYRDAFNGQFCLRTLPWYFLNRRRAVTHTHTAEHYGVTFTDGVRTEVETANGHLRLWHRSPMAVSNWNCSPTRPSCFGPRRQAEQASSWNCTTTRNTT
jgi:hypothetical protein